VPSDLSSDTDDDDVPKDQHQMREEEMTELQNQMREEEMAELDNYLDNLSTPGCTDMSSPDDDTPINKLDGNKTNENFRGQ
jgi:hypothetical protein